MSSSQSVAVASVNEVQSAFSNPKPDEPLQYSCKRCRTVLFTTKDVLFHDPTKNTAGHKKFKHQNYHLDEQKEECTSVFLDPDVNPWVAAEARMEAIAACGGAVAGLTADEDDIDDIESQASSVVQKVVTGATGAYAHLNGTTYNSDSEESWLEDEEDWGVDDDDIYDPEEDEENDVPIEELVVDSRPDFKPAAIKEISSNKSNKSVSIATKRTHRKTCEKARPPPPTSSLAAESRVEDFVPEVDTVYCPNTSCRAKIGAQSWIGSQCSCGAWVTPSFKLHAKHLDKIPIRLLQPQHQHRPSKQFASWKTEDVLKVDDDDDDEEEEQK